MRYIKRLIYLPQGILEGLITFVNKHARDVENRKRFHGSIIEKGSSFSLNTSIEPGAHIFGNSIINNCRIGKYTYVGRNSLLQNTTIGNYCSIAHDVNIGLGKHPLHFPCLSPIFYKRDNPFNFPLVKQDSDFEEYENINIGHDVWIGARVIILDGVSIGSGAVLAAGAVITKDVPPYSIVGGIPAMVIRYRFDDERIIQLLKSEWWLLPPKEAYTKMNSL